MNPQDLHVDRADQLVASDAVYYQGNDAPRNLSANQVAQDEIITKSILDLESRGERHTFTFSNCSSKLLQKGNWFASSKTKHWKHLLQNVSGELRGGTDVAIMGPSGAGKSTLLNLLTLIPSTATVEGDIRLNGHILTDSMFKRYCAYVPQEDYLWPFLTCRETIEFSADFYLGLGSADRRERVDELLSDLGLTSCQHTRCGNQFIQGLSGGQKRRLSLALALIKQPAVLFLDELTSGLDSFAAAEIMTVVRRVARATGIVVICTIHQPSIRVYNEFDTVMLLSAGRVAFNGPTLKAMEHFAQETGRAPPDDLSPCEFMLEAINSDFGGPEKKEQVGRLLSAWTSRQGPPQPVEQPRELPSGGGRETPLYKQVFAHDSEPELLPVLLTVDVSNPAFAHACFCMTAALGADLDPPSPPDPALLQRPNAVPEPDGHVHDLQHLLRMGVQQVPGPQPISGIVLSPYSTPHLG
jgi:ABC-type multidrug transport system ATPase subunit